MNPIVIGYHLIWTAYGWWLPNDPRGSMSRRVFIDVIAQLGDLHYGRKRVQPAGWEIRRFYERAADKLKFPLLTFDPFIVQMIATAFAEVIALHRYTCYACVIMPAHIHMLIRKHRDDAEMMVANLQRASRDRLRVLDIVDQDHPVWVGPGRKVFEDSPEDMWRTIGYVEQNPIKSGLPRQLWPFVKPYDNWPLHEGHDPNSPYAKIRRRT